jgi:hypothetical protein
LSNLYFRAVNKSDISYPNNTAHPPHTNNPDENKNLEPMRVSWKNIKEKAKCYCIKKKKSEKLFLKQKQNLK